MSLLSRIKKKLAKVEKTVERAGRRAARIIEEHRRHKHIPKIKIPIPPPPGRYKILPIVRKAAPVARVAARVSPVLTAAAIGYEAGKQFRKYREKKKRQEVQMLTAELQRQKQKEKRIEKLRKMPLDVAFVREQQLKKRREEIKRESKKKKEAIAEATKKQEAKIKEAADRNLESVCIGKVIGTVKRAGKKSFRITYDKKLYDVLIDYTTILVPPKRIGKYKPSRDIKTIRKGWVDEGKEVVYIRCEDTGDYYEVIVKATPTLIGTLEVPEERIEQIKEEVPEYEEYTPAEPLPTITPPPPPPIPVTPPGAGEPTTGITPPPEEEKKKEEGIQTEYIIAGLFALAMMTKKGEKQ